MSAGTGGSMPAMTTAAAADASTMQQVQLVEQLAAAMTSSTVSAEQRASAQQQIAAMGKQTQHIPLIRAVMDHSQQAVALQTAANALTSLVTDFWASYTVSQRVELREWPAVALRGSDADGLCRHVWQGGGCSSLRTRRPPPPHAGDYLLTFLANKGPHVEVYVISAFIKLLCRITKLAWFDEGGAHRKLVDEVKKLLQVRAEAWGPAPARPAPPSAAR